MTPLVLIITATWDLHRYVGRNRAEHGRLPDAPNYTAADVRFVIESFRKHGSCI